ncbi:hypothetical protein cand_001550 [Cryptosporidium andersoni]|uniref:Uncharacterized protein n=1 Tax=Cryptosporidium andersoni TaxID=117008 RepID=A0A1J4MQJ6_9CRYT|nr:hypothetical protein cand_001550 [Cryptosporidium andersoni]
MIIIHNESKEAFVETEEVNKLSSLSLDGESVDTCVGRSEPPSVVITPTGASKCNSIDDVTTCTTNGSDLMTPIENGSNIKRPRIDDSDKAVTIDSPVIKQDESSSESMIESQYLRFQTMNTPNTPGNSLLQTLSPHMLVMDPNFVLSTNALLQSGQYGAISAALGSTIGTSPSGILQTPGLKSQITSEDQANEGGFEIATKFTAINQGDNNVGRFISNIKGNHQNSDTSAITSKSTTASTSPINQHRNCKESNECTNNKQLYSPTKHLFDELLQLAAVSSGTACNSQIPQLEHNNIQHIQNFSFVPMHTGNSSNGDSINGISPSLTPSSPNNNPVISQLLSSQILSSPSLQATQAQLLTNPFLSRALGPNFNWPMGSNNCNPMNNSNVANTSTLAAFLAATSQQNSTLNNPNFTNNHVSRSINGSPNSILLSMQSTTPSDGSTCDSSQFSVSNNGTSTTPMIRITNANSHNPNTTQNSLAYWPINNNIMALLNSGDIPSTVTALNSNSLNLHGFLQSPFLSHTPRTDDSRITRNIHDMTSVQNSQNQANCMSLLAALQSNIDLTTSSPAALAAAATAALVNATGNSSANYSIINNQLEFDNKSINKSTSSSSLNRPSHSSSRSSTATSSVTAAAAAALDHLDVDWDSVGLREAELAAIEICKTASSLFETTDETTPVPNNPSAIGEAILTASQLTISARAMLKFVKSLTPTQLGINWHACTQRFCVTYTTRDEQNPRSWTLGAYSNGKLHYKYFGPRSWTILGLKEALRKAFKARTSLLLGQGIIEEPEDTGLSKEELTYHARQLLQQLRDSLGVKKGNVHKGLYISWHPKTRRFVVALKSCDSGKTIYKYFSPKERSIEGIKTALLDAHQMVVAACQ